MDLYRLECLLTDYEKDKNITLTEEQAEAIKSLIGSCSKSRYNQAILKSKAEQYRQKLGY